MTEIILCILFSFIVTIFYIGWMIKVGRPEEDTKD